jgi:hypothetical protein
LLGIRKKKDDCDSKSVTDQQVINTLFVKRVTEKGKRTETLRCAAARRLGEQRTKGRSRAQQQRKGTAISIRIWDGKVVCLDRNCGVSS